MSVTIRDLLKLPVFNGARVVAGHTGLDAVVMSVSVLESANERALGINWLGVSSQYNHEIMIGALIEAKDDVQKQLETLRRIRKEGQIGVILYYVGYVLKEIDTKVIDFANEIGMPLIVMPSDLRLRYSDAITEIMETIIEDKRKNDYFASDIIERLSKLDTEDHTINNVLAIIRDRTQSSVFLYDESERELNRVEWPRGRGLPIDEINREVRSKESKNEEISEVCINGSTFSVRKCRFEAAGSIIEMVVVKERLPLTHEECDQIQYILLTYINLWANDYGRVDTKQLISSIIHDEPEKMRRIARSMKLDITAISSVYYLYPVNELNSVNPAEQIRRAKRIVSEELRAYSNKFIVDTFDQVLVIMADRKREQIDEDLPIILDRLAEEDICYNAVICNPILSTRMVKEAYWLFRHNIDAARIIFPRKQVLSIGEIDYAKTIKENIDKEGGMAFVCNDLYELLVKDRKDAILIDTLACLLLDADMSVTETASLMNVHKSTIKYRIKCIEEIIGHRISKAPELYALYQIAGTYRLGLAE